MVAKAAKPVRIDLSTFKLHVGLKPGLALTLHFNTPSRRFYLTLLAFLVSCMKRSGKIALISLQDHLELLALLNETVGESAGSSSRENLLGRIYRKWKSALPDLGAAPLFRVLGRSRATDVAPGKSPPFTEAERDLWANLFEYEGSEENVRLRFSLDRIGLGLDDVLISWEEHADLEAWEQFVSRLRQTHSGLPGSGSHNEVQPSAPGQAPALQTEFARRPHGRLVVLAFVSLLIVAGAGVIVRKMGALAPSDVDPPEMSVHPVPEKPSLAVLPFVNLSGDPAHDALVDAITESIITTLSAEPRLLVIARNSTFIYKGKAVRVQEVAEALGVRYVLEGSVLNSGDRIRVSAQLIDALRGQHLWVEQYDRELKDIFALQDDLAINVLRGMHVKLTTGEGVLSSEPPKHLETYLKAVQGVDYLRKFNIDDNNRARLIAEECIALEPNYWGGYAVLSGVHMMDYLLGSTKDRRESLNEVIGYQRKARDLTTFKGRRDAVLGYLYALRGDYEEAIELGEQAIAMVPNGADAHAWLGLSLNHAGRPEEALPLFNKAMRLNPFPPAFYYSGLSTTCQLIGRYEEAVDMFKKTIQRRPNNTLAHSALAATYVLMGRQQEARVEVAELLRINPEATSAHIAKTLRFKSRSDEEIEQILEGLRRAGLR